MSSQTDDFPPISFQKLVISGGLNSTLLFLFLAGGYIGFSIFALYIYSRSQAKQKVVIATLTGLFITIIVQLVVEWYYTCAFFAGTPKNRLDIYIFNVYNVLSPLAYVAPAVAQRVGQILTDGLLVWRCWKILSRQRHIKLGLVFIYITEIVLILISIVYNGLEVFVPNDTTVQFARQCDIIQGSSYCITATTSVLATFIIGAQIHRSTHMNTGARRRYRHIIEITIQSSALYTLAMVGYAVLALIGNGDINSVGSTLLNATVYMDVFVIITTVFAPTLMVARLEWAKNNKIEDFSTNITSDPQDVDLSAFVVIPQPHSRYKPQDVSRTGTSWEIRTAEV